MRALNAKFELLHTAHVPAGARDGEMRQRSILPDWGGAQRIAKKYKNSGNEAKK